MTYKIMKNILKLITVVLLIAAISSCNKKVVTQSTTTETNVEEVTEKDFSLDSVMLNSRDTVYLTQYDTITEQEVKVQYVWNDSTGSAELSVDCPDIESEVITVTETTDISEETKQKIEDKHRKRYDKNMKKLKSELEKDLKNSRDEWYKEGLKKGKSKGRWQTIIGLAVIAGIIFVLRKKLPLPF